MHRLQGAPCHEEMQWCLPRHSGRSQFLFRRLILIVNPHDSHSEMFFVSDAALARQNPMTGAINSQPVLVLTTFV